MSITYISAALRRLVIARADMLCEYCLIAEEHTSLGCAVDHVISEKHEGPTVESNLALACVFCNDAKGSDIGSVVHETGEFVRLFNPRTDRWGEHFQLNGDRIEGRTPIGRVTARLLGFNRPKRIAERRSLSITGRFPTFHALLRINTQ